MAEIACRNGDRGERREERGETRDERRETRDEDIFSSPIISAPIYPIVTKFGIHVPCVIYQGSFFYFFEIRIIFRFIAFLIDFWTWKKSRPSVYFVPNYLSSYLSDRHRTWYTCSL